MKLKKQENEAFENILYILDDISAIPKLQWDYHMSFSGFAKYLQEEQIKNYALVLDKEESRTNPVGQCRLRVKWDCLM